MSDLIFDKFGKVDTAIKRTGTRLMDLLDAAIKAAVDESSTTVAQWGSPVNRDKRQAGGVHHSTYKAICRKKGLFSNPSGTYDWNLELANPMIKILTRGWEKVFTHRIPAVMITFAEDAQEVVHIVHQDINTCARVLGIGGSNLQTLDHQLSVYKGILTDIGNTGKELVINKQKEINREITPVIKREMTPGYEKCEAETGTHCWKSY